MNPFVNFNKRGVALPKGCTDLMDVLQTERTREPKTCVYCDETAVATQGWPDDYRWCEACQHDLKEFAGKEDYKAARTLNDATARALYLADLQRRQDEFMLQRVKERKAS